ncbi:putative TIM-barrel fold metal-dependent hydrolase [Hydrogenophaga palleronii]|uniref:TIM-barrel fold metal-dependent hydrolase n=1 Tax=Hydrogenophaga palleronii TaxID=65655 RepID=A0ABU1WIN2_9BURK|nr:amidohydrolase family protein [Hydrogenophaga palleronii]MDR7149134.1 putative TIM-barrel fold metal-dependent hydrolase [Hydrogenophaga palleronii]
MIIDCHFHVVAPADDSPMVAGRSYTPEPASLDDWKATLEPVGVTHGVVVQPSFYGTDNRVLLRTLGQTPNRLVGVAAVDIDVDDAALNRLTAAGVKGVRMAHFEEGDPRCGGGFVRFSAFQQLLQRLRDHNLHLQLFTDSRLLPGIADQLANADISIVIDHMGRAPADLGPDHDGIRAMRGLLSLGQVWIKLSGIANLSNQAPEFANVRSIHESLIDARPDRLIWGSDWPHTKPYGQKPSALQLLRLFQSWTPKNFQPRILKDNPAKLYGFAEP